MLTLIRRTPLVATFITLAFACIAWAGVVRAESVVWSALQPDLIARGANGPDRATQYLYDPMVTISYNVRVSEIDENGNRVRVLPSGSVIPKGTRVIYEFIDHEYSDIYWFGAGKTWDSPYGDWIAGAGPVPYTQRCADKNKYFEKANYGNIHSPIIDLFAALSVAPPQKNISVSGGVSCDNEGNGSRSTCVLSEEGNVTAQFTFAPTEGKFYPGYQASPDYTGRDLRIVATGDECSRTSKSFGEQNTMKKTARDNQQTSYQDGGVFVMSVPQQTIPHTLIVSDDATTQPPSTPTVASTGGACIVGQPHSIEFTSTDPDGDDIRYGVDWNDDDSIDQWVPPTGYVTSGTTRSASRTYVTPGTKTVQVLAQDEGGMSSSFERISFTCSGAAEATTDDATLNVPATIGDGSDSTASTLATDLSLRAVPSLVRPGETTSVHWSTTNMDSCTVSGSNGDRWSGTASPVGGETSAPINARVTYTLLCTDIRGERHSKQANVYVLPRWVEL